MTIHWAAVLNRVRFFNRLNSFYWSCSLALFANMSAAIDSFLEASYDILEFNAHSMLSCRPSVYGNDSIGFFSFPQWKKYRNILHWRVELTLFANYWCIEEVDSAITSKEFININDANSIKVFNFQKCHSLYVRFPKRVL